MEKQAKIYVTQAEDFITEKLKQLFGIHSLQNIEIFKTLPFK